MSKYLVTGGAGFIGSHITEELVKRGHAVRIVDNFLTGKRENINSFLDKIELIEGDIRDSEVCARAAEGVDFVLHQAALPSVPRSVKDPVTTNDINIKGTLNLLLASRDAKAKKFVFASSSSVYGDDPRLPKKEGTEGTPLSPYAISKRGGEMYCLVFSQIFNLSTICLRYFNIFGPRQDPFSQYAAVIPNFITKMIKEEKPVIFGDGEQSRDFTYVANVVEANILAAETQDISGEIFNIACGERTTVNSLAAKTSEILKKEIPPTYCEPRPGDVKHSFADVSKAQKILKYKPAVQFDKGLEETIRWYRES
ncbi:MAG: SDR family oxidoreductase [Candidatus Aminicenantes bacterium]|nr:SDR family oxidoreductase [Candidatus Aminicenantes bacterium]MBL7083012.1 SDR family oxidoreductase [Candidatus Aminicenantes bacterium]